MFVKEGEGKEDGDELSPEKAKSQRESSWECIRRRREFDSLSFLSSSSLRIYVNPYYYSILGMKDSYICDKKASMGQNHSMEMGEKASFDVSPTTEIYVHPSDSELLYTPIITSNSLRKSKVFMNSCLHE